MSAYLYKLIKASWGIWVEIDAEWQLRSKYAGSVTQISEKVFVTVLGRWSTEADIEMIHFGLSLMADALTNKLQDSEPIVIVIERVEYPLCDYQAEGLVPAVMGWVSREFDLPLPEFSASFDKGANRYLFEFPTRK